MSVFLCIALEFGYIHLGITDPCARMGWLLNAGIRVYAGFWVLHSSTMYNDTTPEKLIQKLEYDTRLANFV